jgi:hypothetical protein
MSARKPVQGQIRFASALPPYFFVPQRSRSLQSCILLREKPSAPSGIKARSASEISRIHQSRFYAEVKEPKKRSVRRPGLTFSANCTHRRRSCHNHPCRRWLLRKLGTCPQKKDTEWRSQNLSRNCQQFDTGCDFLILHGFDLF